MRKIILPNDHISLTSAKEVESICQPLKKYFNVTHFSFVRAYKNGDRVHLTMNTDWQVHFYNKFCEYAESDKLNNSIDRLHSGFLTWDELPIKQLLHDIKNYFNTANGVLLIDKYEGYADEIFFGSTSNNYHATTNFVSNLDLLKKFIEFFKQQAAPLIKKAEKERLRIPSSSSKYETIKINEYLSHQDKNDFIRNICLNNNKMTKRELECINLYFTGNSAKKIAKTLTISPRTVDKHLENIKRKLGCNKNISILKKYIELGFML